MAGVTFTPGQAPCQATVSVRRDGTAHVRSAATDLGTGTYTIATQVTAELLGLDTGQVRVEIGDSDLPFAPYSGGSGMATSLSGAIQDAVGKLVGAFLDVVADELSPLQGRRPDEVVTTQGGIHVVGAPSTGEAYAGILARHGLPEITADGERDPRVNRASEPPSGSFAARFAEVRVDQDLGLLRVTRIVSALDAGRILGIKGIGEIAIVGVSAAIANAAYHATGRRIRSLPITVEQLL